MKEIYESLDVKATEDIGRRFAARLKPGDVVAMYGELGAGKTAFVRGVVNGLGCDEPVSSPTFAIVCEYDTPNAVVDHFDMYRIDTPDDLWSTGFYDYLDGMRIILIEWSENVPYVVEETASYTVAVRGSGNDKREIIIEERSRQ